MATIQMTFKISYALVVTLMVQPTPTRCQDIGEHWHPRRPARLTESERENYERAITAIRLAVATAMMKRPKSDYQSENQGAAGQ